MSIGIDHVMNTPQTAIGKGTVGEPPKDAAGRTGVTIHVALFYDGTLNNRTNTNKRLSKPGILDKSDKNERSSYANFYSNVAIMEYMNLRQKPEQKHISVYVEGIGTVNFEEGAQKKDDKDNPVKDKNGRPVLLSDAENSNDERQGFAFGSGPTGIRDRVTKGIDKVNTDIRKRAYNPKKEFIEKIIVDVVGFSRGAAAARHFVSRQTEVPGPLPTQARPEVVINFVGLYETVSSFDEGGKDNWGLAGNFAQKITEGLFDDDVLQLGLNIGGVPRRVVHLTAADEYRNNFSLTTIDTSRAAGVGFELALPGVHSDIGGAYAEPDPNNPTMDPSKPIRALNQEVRRIKSSTEKQRLIQQGWYTDGSRPGTPNQFRPAYQASTPALAGKSVQVGDYRIPVLPSIRSYQPGFWEDGVRYLTNEYQYIPLFIMLDFAQNGAGYASGSHEAMKFESLSMAKNQRYRVPARLQKLRDSFLAQARKLTGSRKHERVDLLTTPALAGQLHWLRNHYLHRSARAPTEGMAYVGMESADNETRVIIRDDVLVKKFSGRTKDRARAVPATVGQGVEAAKQKMRDLWNRQW